MVTSGSKVIVALRRLSIMFRCLCRIEPTCILTGEVSTDEFQKSSSTKTKQIHKKCSGLENIRVGQMFVKDNITVCKEVPPVTCSVNSRNPQMLKNAIGCLCSPLFGHFATNSASCLLRPTEQYPVILPTPLFQYGDLQPPSKHQGQRTSPVMICS
jgi:hypothetical protein